MAIPVTSDPMIRREGVSIMEASTRNNPSIQAINDGLVGHWSPTLDGSGAGDIPSLVTPTDVLNIRSAQWVADATAFGGAWALQCDAQSPTHDIVNPALRDITGGSAVSVWFKRIGGFGTATTVSWGADAATLASGIRQRFSTGGSGALGGHGPDDSSSQLFAGNINDRNAWMHLVVSDDGAGNLTGYWDGVKASATLPCTGTKTPRSIVAIGNEGSPSYGNGRDGYYDTLRLYNRPLSDAEVTQLFDAGRNEDGLGGGGEPPENTTPPLITGNPYIGETLTTSYGLWTGQDSVVVKWERSDDGSTDWTQIAGNVTTYIPTSPDDLNKYIRTVATATNGDGSTEEPSSNVVGPITEPIAAQNNFTFQAF